jgi:D-amino-acid dehydrogenase
MRSDTVLIVGAGIVGLATAHVLRREGWKVALIDANPPGSQASSGNAGAISAGSVAPLALPGIVRSTPRMLLDRKGPLHIPLRYLPQASPWLLRFVRAAGIERVEAIAGALAGLLRGSVAAHQRMARESDCGNRIIVGGQLHCYPDSAALAKDSFSWALKRAHGLRTQIIRDGELRGLEPAVSPRYTRAVFLPEEAWVDGPFEYAQAVASGLRARGIRFLTEEVRGLERAGDHWLAHTEARPIAARHVVLAAGAWSAKLLSPLGWRVPLETQRGYHVDIDAPGVALRRVVVLADRKVFLTPMRGGLRAAGTVEFGGLERPMTAKRAMLIGRHARQGLPKLANAADDRLWMGHRPCLPDSMPVLGAVPGAAGLWCAFGHGHLGLTGSVRSAELLAAAMRGEAVRELLPFSIERFS